MLFRPASPLAAKRLRTSSKVIVSGGSFQLPLVSYCNHCEKRRNISLLLGILCLRRGERYDYEPENRGLAESGL